MNVSILTDAAQQFIRENTGSDIARLLFKKQRFPGIDQKELATQLESREKCEKKLPLWYATPRIYYPPKLAIEQASSALTAAYKSALITGKSLIDLTGGFGADSFYFSKQATEVIHCEINEDLSAIAAHNAKVLGAGNIIHVNDDGLKFLEAAGRRFDTLYIDPSRRLGSSKVFILKDCVPDVVSHLGLLQQKAERILIKTSPLLDLQAGIYELKNVAEIHIVSVKNECKELIWVIDSRAVQEPRIVCSRLNGRSENTFAFYLSEERSAIIAAWSSPLSFLYEPDGALLKGGCFKLIALRFGLKKLHQHSHLYTSDVVIENFAGKVFTVQATLSYKEFTSNNTITKAHIISRNFPLTAENIKKKHRIQEGGDEYLFFTKTLGDQLIVIYACRTAT